MLYFSGINDIFGGASNLRLFMTGVSNIMDSFNFSPLSGVDDMIGQVSRYDRQRCVPRIICEFMAGTQDPETRQRNQETTMNDMLA